MFNKVYELPLAIDYVKHWGVAEAVREIFQNAIDSESPFEYTIEGDSLTITSRYSTLQPSSLLLGTTSKSDRADKIGSFGEGFKIALLVLTRERKPVTVYNGDKLWKPEFRTSRTFSANVLAIVESNYPEGRGTGLSFKIDNLSDEEFEVIKSSNMHMWETIGRVHNTSKGQILLDHPGKLFVNGLFVCDTELQYGYNVKPEFLKLERDRQTVNSFDLKFLAKDMWFQTGEFGQIAQMIDKGVADLEYANYGAPEMVRQACYELFTETYPGAVSAESQKQLKELISKGFEKVVVVGYTLHSIVSSCQRADGFIAKVSKTPLLVLTEWLAKNRSSMRKDAIVAYKDLLKQAEHWK